MWESSKNSLVSTCILHYVQDVFGQLELATSSDDAIQTLSLDKNKTKNLKTCWNSLFNIRLQVVLVLCMFQNFPNL